MKKYDVKIRISCDCADAVIKSYVVEACTFSQAIAKSYRICDDTCSPDRSDCDVDIVSIVEQVKI